MAKPLTTFWEQLLLTTAASPYAEIQLETSQQTDPCSTEVPLSPKQTKYAEGEESLDTVHKVITRNISSALGENKVRPPEIQRMAVEDIVKSDSPSSVSFRLRAFSGKMAQMAKLIMIPGETV